MKTGGKKQQKQILHFVQMEMKERLSFWYMLEV